MKVRACVIGGHPNLLKAFSSRAFATCVLGEIVKGIFGVHDVFSRPAEYHVESAVGGPSPDEEYIGVEVRMTDISRNGRPAKAFHQALKQLEDVADVTACQGTTLRCQIFCVLELDGEIETAPGSGKYSSVLEGTAFFADERQKDK